MRWPIAEAIAEAIARREAELPSDATALDAAATVYAAANDWKHRSLTRRNSSTKRVKVSSTCAGSSVVKNSMMNP
jgi:hypothetical protein